MLSGEPRGAAFETGPNDTIMAGQMRANQKLDLIEHLSSKEKKLFYASRLFQTIAPRYDFITAFLSYGMDKRWKRRLVAMASPTEGETALDIACGTGDITFSIASSLTGGLAAGLDLTQGMLDIAERKRRDAAAANVCFHRADIMRMPFADEVFDCVTGGYALRNVPDIAGALAEIKRVLRPGGRLFSLDFGHPGNRLCRALYLRYLTIAGSAMGLALHGDADTYRYIAETLKRYPGQRGVMVMMKAAGFVRTGIHEFGGGIMAINYGMKP